MRKNMVIYFALALILLTPGGYRTAFGARHTPEDRQYRGDEYYIVRQGDNLWDIARRVLGDGLKYTVIYEANKAIIGMNPNLIYPDQILHVPGIIPSAGRFVLQPGEIIEFGGMNWIVLAVNDGRALILSERVLEGKAYRVEPARRVTWETNPIRAYLNGEFYENTFSEAEKLRIIETTVANKDNEWYGAYGGGDTTDKLFLLSLEEVCRYFGGYEQLLHRPETHEKWGDGGGSPAYYHYEWGDRDGRYYWRDALGFFDESGSRKIACDAAGAPASWWLRSPGEHGINAAIIFYNGIVSVSGISVYHNLYSGSGGIRPALWLNP